MLDRLLQAAVVAAWWRWWALDSPSPVFMPGWKAIGELQSSAFREGVEHQRAVEVAW